MCGSVWRSLAKCRGLDWSAVAGIYWIGVALGLGVSTGALLAGLLAISRAGIVAAVVAAGLVGATVGYTIWGVEEAAAGALGGLAGAAGSATVVRGAHRRGGVRGATALLIGVAALAGALLAFVPLFGFVEAILLPVVGLRVRRREGDRYAGLRILARD